MASRITERRKDILSVLAKLETARARPIQAGELAEALGMTKQSLAEHLAVLVGQDLVARPGGRYGALLLTVGGRRVIGARIAVPVIGRIAAGEPILAEHHIEREVDRLRDLLKLREGDFFLIAHGDSMAGAGIHDGDLVAVHATPDVLDGEIAVVFLPNDNTSTLKRLYRRGDQVVLESENPAYPPMSFPVAEVQVQGKYAGHVALARPRRSASSTEGRA